MSSIYKVIEEYREDSAAVEKFCNDLYNDMFANHFVEVREMYSRMQSELHPLTDTELEYILTAFPMELFAVAENLNKLRLDTEIVKLKNKKKVEDVRKAAIAETKVLDMTKAEKQDYIMHRTSEIMPEYEILLAAYNSVITRVENEQSFSRELIMGAKKIWDSRRSAETVNPVEPVVSELPEYNRNQYVK